MFKDTEKELKRLEEELLEADRPNDADADMDTDELLAQLHETLDETPVAAYNADRVDADLEAFSEAVEAPPAKEKLTGLVVAALLLTAGILGLLAWCLVRLMG